MFEVYGGSLGLKFMSMSSMFQTILEHVHVHVRSVCLKFVFEVYV